MADRLDDALYYATGQDALLLSQRASETTQHITQTDAEILMTDNRITHIDAEIARLQNERAQCQRQRAVLLDVRERHMLTKDRLTRPLHPLRKTPPEVIGAIFEACLDDSTAHAPIAMEPALVTQRQRTPFVLASVCRAWRHASLLSPRAWRIVETRLDPPNQDALEAQLAYLHCVLHRSADTGLTIRVARAPVLPDAPEDRAAFVVQASAELLAPLAAVMRRTESLLFIVDGSPGPTDPASVLLATPMPVLRNLYYVPAGWDGWTRAETRHFFPASTKLSTIHTRFPNIGPDTDVLRILREAPALHTLSMHRPACLPFNRYGAPLVHDGITELLLTHRDSIPERGALAHLSLHLRMPNLRNLHMHGSDSSAADRLAFFVALASQGAPLRHVMLYDVGTDWIDAVVAGLQLCTKLHSFSLVGARFSGAALERFVGLLTMPWTPPNQDQERNPNQNGNQETWVCPELYALRLSKCAFDDDADTMDLALLVQRRRAVGRPPLSVPSASDLRPVLLRKFAIDRNPRNSIGKDESGAEESVSTGQGNLDKVTQEVRVAISRALRDMPIAPMLSGERAERGERN